MTIVTRSAGSCVLVAAASVVLLSATASADDIPVFNTGVDNTHHVIATGNADQHYTLVALPSGTGLTVPRAATVALAHPAYLPNDAIGSTGSRWIALFNDTNMFYPSGNYVYRTTFDLTGLDPATAVVDGVVAVDNSVTDVRLNGVSFGSLGGAFAFYAASFHLGGGFVQGVNTLDFVVLNAAPGSSPSGLRVVVTGTAAPAIPPDHTPPSIFGCFDRSLSWQGASITLVPATLGITAVDAVDGSVPVVLSPNVVGLGTHTITASAHDAAGNVAANTFTVRVLDVTAPVITGPSSATPTFQWHGSQIALTASQLGLSATDDVDGTVSVVLTPSSVGLGDTSVTARATDAAGNTATRSFTVRVVDVTAPVIAGPSPATPTFGWAGSNIALTASLLGLSATDDVDASVAVSLSPSSVGLGNTSVTATATDAAGNSSSRTFTVRVLDVTAPVISGPSSSTPTFGWAGSNIVLTASLLGLSATDDVNGSVAVSLSPSSVGLGNTSVTATATDAAGNSSSRTFTVRVLDVTAPVISGPSPATPTFGWAGSNIALTASLLGLSATDDVDGSVAVSLSPSSVGLGNTSVTATATDAAGNSSSRTFTVRVLDVTAPVISGPSPATPTFGWAGSNIALTASLLGLSATDDVNGSVAVSLSPSSVGLGSTSVTATATDAAGNSSSRTFTVRVLDVTAPVISGPSPATPTFEWHGSAIALTPSVLGLSATDDVDGAVAVTLSTSSAGLGDTVVTASAADAAGNASSRQFTVRVRDTTAPTILSITASPSVITAKNHTMAQVVVSASVSDAGDSSPSIHITSVTCTDDGHVSGPSLSADDWNVTGDLTVDVRAERTGKGSGRTYVIALVCTDASGNSTTGTVSVFVPHDNGSSH